MKDGADRIVQRIMDDAETRAGEIIAEAEKISEKIITDARQKASSMQEQIMNQAKKSAAEQKWRIMGVAQLEARKNLLTAKQEMISQVFDQILDELIELDEQAYLSLMRELLLNLVETGSEKVLCSARDKERIPREFWRDVNKELANKGKKGELKLSEETRDIQGGFILLDEGVEMNCSFESLLEMKRDDLEPEVASLLF